MHSTTGALGGTARSARLLNALPWFWLAMSVAWAVVIVATDQPAWPLALWIAITVGPITAHKARLDSQAVPAATEHEPAAPPPSQGTKR